ncbi:MAG TPA: carboxymuconolactone decarboxylase family protein [Yinghuangia sp.]|uniref:carboxymuconolactone decarboxylase family protein n=1 Tax=Yinghuangia sp. YIM S10712 TaxID=3436930 RepID=UPI002BE834A8|nr:carboxymuconolactone decarboxylase family protein [Yinghuangia sp.]
MTRIEPIPVREWPAEMRGALAAMVPAEPRHPRPETKGRPKGLNVLGIYAHYPALSKAFFTFNGHIMMATSLSLRQRELIVLRVATLRSCAYEWAQHVVMGRDVGLTDEEIQRVAAGPDAPGWEPAEAALLRAMDDLVHDGRIGEETWKVLSGEFDTQQLMDIVFTAGAYETLAWLLRSFDVELDDDLPADPNFPGVTGA